MSERGGGVSSEPLSYAPVMGLDCWAEKPSSPNYPLNWPPSGGHEEKLRIQGIDGNIERTDLC
jgi:hypothetical protein